MAAHAWGTSQAPAGTGEGVYPLAAAATAQATSPHRPVVGQQTVTSAGLQQQALALSAELRESRSQLLALQARSAEKESGEQIAVAMARAAERQSDMNLHEVGRTEEEREAGPLL